MFPLCAPRSLIMEYFTQQLINGITLGAIQAWVQAVIKAESTDTGKVVATLWKNKFGTVLGNIGFDMKGDVTAPGYVFYEWKGGTCDYVK